MVTAEHEAAGRRLAVEGRGQERAATRPHVSGEIERRERSCSGEKESTKEPASQMRLSLQPVVTAAAKILN